jgi:glycosyltransferase involved in cell wall biosynthesis
MSTEFPYVSIVTPVHNGGKYLKECIESVLSQTYQNWEYIIQNNFSNDDTLEIAGQYAKKEKRIKIYNTDRLLPIIDNWNDSLRKISPDSDYCKIIHADDLIFPDCIKKMIEIAVKYPSAGIIGSYALLGNKVKFDGLQIDQKIISGKEICRLTFRRKFFLFGSPTTLLFRSDIIKSRDAFYDNKFLHADTEVCYDILQTSDFGFVHQVLSYTRLHDQSQTELLSNKYKTNLMEYFGMLKKYGEIYFSRQEYHSLLRKNFRLYYIFLARNFFQLRNKEFRNYQIQNLKKMGFTFSFWKFMCYFFLVVVDEILNPKRAIRNFVRKFSGKSEF